MAKRFTDTEKWKKPWFRMLPIKMKAAWEYLRDNCDHAGVWAGDFDLMSFQLGEGITAEECLEAFGQERFVPLESGKFFLPSFIEFQYGELKEDNRAHQSVLSILKKEGASKGLTRSSQGRKDKDKDTDKDKDKEAFEEIFKIYPRRKGDQGKARAEKKFSRDFVSDEKRASLLIAVRKYRGHCDANKVTGTEFVKQFSTFLGGAWEEWAAYESPAAPDPVKTELYSDLKRGGAA